MPMYEYECFVCRHRFERLQKLSAEPVKECPECGGLVRRLLGAPALQFRGSGFYITDYGKGGVKPGGDDKPPVAASSESPATDGKASTPTPSNDSGDTPADSSS